MNFNCELDECTSTNDLVKRLGEAGLPSETWISAREQTRGRGRLRRAWKSHAGNLHLSVLVRLHVRFGLGSRSRWPACRTVETCGS